MNEKARVNELIIEDIRKFVATLEKYAEGDACTAASLLTAGDETANRYFASSDAYNFAARWLHHYLGD